jgi:hypothetical protein
MVQSPGEKAIADLKAGERDTSVLERQVPEVSPASHDLLVPWNSRRVFGFCFDGHLRVEGKRAGARHSLP